MLRTDTANFNRFLTSVGLLLLAAALVVPYFYFQNTDTLEIPASDLRGMTETGRDALSSRQHAIASLEVWVVGAAIALALLGAVLVVWGGIRLRTVQESDDEETALRRKRAELEVRQMSPDERAEKVTEEAREEVEMERETPAADAPSDAGGEGEFVEGASELIASIKDRREELERVSEGIEEAFRRKRLRTHKATIPARIGSAIESILLDGLFEAKDEAHTDVVLRTRILAEAVFRTSDAAGIANDLIAQLSRYQLLTGRSARGWMVVVVKPDMSGSDFGSGAFHRALAELERILRPFAKVTPIGDWELETLPATFMAKIGSA